LIQTSAAHNSELLIDCFRLHHPFNSAMSLITFKDVLDSIYDRVDDLNVIIPSLSEIRSRLPLSNVRSCVAVGCGYGLLDQLFMQHCMPSICEFTAIEPDPMCASELRVKLPKQLPGVKTIVCEETVQCWQGADSPVDVVLLVHFLYYLGPVERLALYQRLMDSVLRSGGFVFILIHPHHTSGEPSAYCRVIQQLKSLEVSNEFVSDGEVCSAMLSVGFQLCYERMYECHLNVENPDDAFLSLFLCPEGGWCLESVHQAAKEIFGDSKKVRHDSWLGIFRKP